MTNNLLPALMSVGATGVASASLGTLPAGNMPLIFCGGRYEGNMLCSAMENISPPPALPALPFQNDVILLAQQQRIRWGG